MIADLLPDGPVGWGERFGDTDPGGLFPEEEATLVRAVPKRRREFASGRWCARQALAGIGVAPAPILPGERGAPGWPDGVVGSITHCAGYAAAVAGRGDRFTTLGLDAEPDAPLPPGVLKEVSLPAEREMITALGPGGPAWDRLLFCAKEAVYKAWFPLTRRWLGFDEAHIELSPDGSFTARPLVGTPVARFEGRWRAEKSLLLAVVVLASEGPGSGR